MLGTFAICSPRMVATIDKYAIPPNASALGSKQLGVTECLLAASAERARITSKPCHNSAQFVWSPDPPQRIIVSGLVKLIWSGIEVCRSHTEERRSVHMCEYRWRLRTSCRYSLG
jgi:hypothetical protein